MLKNKVIVIEDEALLSHIVGGGLTTMSIAPAAQNPFVSLGLLLEKSPDKILDFVGAILVKLGGGIGVTNISVPATAKTQI